MTQALMALGGMYLIFLNFWILAVVRAAIKDARDSAGIYSRRSDSRLWGRVSRRLNGEPRCRRND